MRLKLIWAVAAVLLRIWRRSRPAAVLGAVIVIAIGFVHRRRRRKRDGRDARAARAHDDRHEHRRRRRR